MVILLVDVGTLTVSWSSGLALRKSAPVLKVRLPCRIRGVHVCVVGVDWGCPGVDESGSVAIGDAGFDPCAHVVGAVRIMCVYAVAGGCGDNVEAGNFQTGNTRGLIPAREHFHPAV